MNKNKKWYSLFLVMLISLATVIQPIQAVAAVTVLDTAAEETQDKSMETPNVDNIDETNKVVEEEPATSVSEETKTTDTIEETISSEVTEETTASEEKTVESSTEETKESKENPKAKALRAEREPRNIKEALVDTNFLTKVNISVIDSEGKELDYKNQPVPATAKLALDYHFALPNDLLSKKEILAGDYYDIDLPSSIQIAAGKSMELKQGGVVFGTAVVTVEGKIRVTFNEKVEELFNIVGEISYSREFKDTITAGENIIPIPINGGEETIKVDILPNGGTPISKSGALGTDKKSVTWEVDINTNLNKLVNATVTDPMPEGLKLTELKVYEQKINLNGEIIPSSQTLLSKGNGYEHSGDIVTFPGENTKSYKLVYETVVKEDFIPEEGGDRNFHNKAVLTNQGKISPAESSVGVHYGELIKKSGPSKNEKIPGHQYTWTIAYNHGFKDLPKGSKITDTLGGSNQEYVKGVKAWVDGGRWLEEGKDFVVTYNGKNEMEIVFPNGLKEAIYIQYDTKVPFVVDDTTTGESATLTNTATTGGKFSSVGKGTIATNGMTKKSEINYETRRIKWTVAVNIYNNEMVNWSLTDTMTKGLKFDPNSLKIIETGGSELKRDTDFVFEYAKDTEFKVKFLGDRAKKTSSAYTITYETEFDRSNSKYHNTAISYWEDGKGGKYTQTVEKDQSVEQNYTSNRTKSGYYNATNKTITWITMVNYNQSELKNATITDPITGNQKYVDGSAKLLEVKIPTNGSINNEYILTSGVVVPGATTMTNKTVSANLPNGNKAYALVFETSLEGEVITNHTYDNVATYTNDGDSKTVTAKVTPANGGKYASKSGKQDGNNVNWTVTINPSQSTMKNVVVVDKPSTNQVLDNNSIVIYKTKVASNGYISKTNEKLALDEDYKVDIQTNNETGEQVLTVSLLKEINTSYILEYRSLISSTQKYNDTLSNTISINADNDQVNKWETSSKVPVEIFGGSASGSAAALKIVKVDKNDKSKKPLQGAKFELWSTNNGKKGQMVRSGETDENGELKFGNILGGVEYLLFETKAPEGYSVSKQLRDGYRLKTKEDGKVNVYDEIIMENDIPRIELKKVDADTKKAVAKAEFVIKNADDKFYNGIDDKNKSQWVVSEKEAKKLVSNEKGIVEVVGLEPGVYSAKEIKAPLGYDKLTQDVAFEVVDDLGWIRLKNPVTIENKAYETTSVSINKTWNDASNQDGKRPDEITFDLLADGTVVDKLTLSKEDIIADKDIWTKTFDGLRKFDEDMKEITYSVKEYEVSGYVIPKEELEVKNREVNVTNTYKPKLTSISGTKTWVDENNQDGIRPDKVIINLLADGKEIKEVVVNEASDWKYEFKDLPVYKVGEVKQLVKYTVTENKVEGYETTEENNNFTNTHIPATTRVLVEKDWADYNNQDGKRPKEILVQLLADNKEIAGKTLKLEAAKGWKAEFSNLPLKINGKDIAYTIKEIVAEKDKKSGYKPSYDIKKVITKESNTQTDRNEVSHFEAKVTNTKTMEPTIVSGVKTWSDDNNRDGVRPESIEIELLADGQPALDLAGKPVKSLTVKGGNTAKTWSYEFTNIPKHRTVETGKVAEKAEEIVYTVKEVMSEALKTNNYASKATDTSVTNSREIELTKILGIKTWSDDNNRDGVRPESIEVQLLADGKPALDKDGKEIPVKEVKGGNTAQEWTYEFKDLPKHKAVKADEELVEEANRAIVYTVKEIVSEELESNNYTSKATDMNVTNSREIELTEVSGVKTWSDDNNRDGVRPESIEVQLLADGKPALDKDGKEISVQTVTGGNTEVEWTYEFKDLPKHKAVKAGEELVEEADRAIVYSVKEEAVEGYTSKVDGMNITNSREIELTEVSGKKIWNDNENRSGARPELIEVQLLADGEPALDKEGKEIPVKEVKGGNTEVEWTYEFTNLPKHKAVKVGEELVEEADRAIVYTVKEVISEDLAKNGYIAVENGMDVTNTREVIEIPVTKIWKDANNKDGIRPESIKVQLLADGKEAKDVKGEKIISEVTGSMKSNEWIDTFKDLPKFANGKEIKYSVKEIEISKEYEVTYSDDTFTITNTHTPKEVPTSGKKSTNNKSGYLPKTGEAETTALVNLGVTMIVIFLMSHIWLSQRRKSKED
ncbi:Cna B-type domain-containing protein [Vagococcus fluvialis]|uniref:Cna B-type domain-containing protein n=1 Tax=Vagococcus fluvialis TaxID=2738 RepID=UPI0032E3782C